MQEPAYDFSKVLERAAELGAKRLIICDAGEACFWSTTHTHRLGGWVLGGAGGAGWPLITITGSEVAERHMVRCMRSSWGSGFRTLPACQPPPPCPALPAGARRVRVKVALNVAANDVCMVLSSDPELPWLEQALSRATMAPVTMAE